MNRSRVSLIGLIVLVVGLASAEGIYWFGLRADADKATRDALTNAIQLESQRKTDREIEMGFGKVYLLVIHAEQWWTALPAYQQAALWIIVLTLIVALACFILAAKLHQ
jgi:hypothetical protein